MSFTTKLAAGVMLAAATSTALTGCGKKSSTTTTSTSRSSSTSMSASAKPTVMATINGKVKHIHAGQDCQKKYADQYTQYGFTCAPKTTGSSEWVLTAK